MKKASKPKEASATRSFFKWLVHGPPSPSTVDVVLACVKNAILCEKASLLFGDSKVLKFRDKVIAMFYH